MVGSVVLTSGMELDDQGLLGCDIDSDSDLLDLKPLCGDGDGVVSTGHRGDGEVAGIARGRFEGQAGVDVGSDGAGAFNHRSGGIGDGADDGAVVALRREAGSEQGKR